MASGIEDDITGPMLRYSKLVEPVYLYFAYRYYEKGESLISDSAFDSLAKYLQLLVDNYEITTDIITEGDMGAGTFLGEYPEWIVEAEELMGYRQSGLDWRAYDQYVLDFFKIDEEDTI